MTKPELGLRRDARPARRAGLRRSSTGRLGLLRLPLEEARAINLGGTGGCSSSPSSPSSAEASSAMRTSRPPTSREPHRAASTRTTSTSARRSVTPTSSRSSSPSSWSAPRPDLPRRSCGRASSSATAQRLDRRLQRPVLAAASVRAGLFPAVPAMSDRSARRRLDRLRRGRDLRAVPVRFRHRPHLPHHRRRAREHCRRARRGREPLLQAPAAPGPRSL